MSYLDSMYRLWMNLPGQVPNPLEGRWSVLEAAPGPSSAGSCACRCPRCGKMH